VLPQGEVLEGELAMATAEEREEAKQVEQEGAHRAEILSGSAPTDQSLAADRGFVEGQLANLTLARGDRNAEPAVRLPTK